MLAVRPSTAIPLRSAPRSLRSWHLPQVTYAAEIKKDGDAFIVKRMLEDGYMTVKVHTPCLITCIKELNQPRYHVRWRRLRVLTASLWSP